MPPDQYDFRAEMEKPAYAAIAHKLRTGIVPTRQLLLIRSELAMLQQQVAAGWDEAGFWGGENRLPMMGAIIIGESGCGKSFGLKYALASLPEIQLPDGTSMPSNPLFVDTPTYGTVATLAKEIVRLSDGVEMREPRDQDAPQKAIRAFARHKYSLVAVDEISRILNAKRHFGRGLAVQSQLVWTLGIEALNLSMWPTPFVVCGLPHLVSTLSIHDKDEGVLKVRREAQRRFNVLRVPDLDFAKDGAILEGAIRNYCAEAQVETMLSDDDLIVPRLIHAAYNQAGTALEIAQQAVALAKVRPRGKLKRADFAAVYQRITSAPAGANPFRVDDWERIDVGVVAPMRRADALFSNEVE